MNSNVSSSTVVFVLACSIIANTAYSQPRGSSPQQTNSTPNFYITTPQTGESVPAGQQAASQQTLNTYTATTTWQPSTERQANTRQAASSARSTRSNAAAQQAAYNTYTNYYTQGSATQHTAQQTYPSYVAHASARHTTEEKKGLLSRLLHRNHDHTPKTATVTQVSNNAVKRSRYSGTVQSGTASWYGSDWHGKKTANGERYNMESMTAAHRTLPFGTLVKVRNERNGRECVVRINNRGPFTKGRILDLSKAAARHLGMVSSGVAKVKMEVLGNS